jgi:hypothetical protein
MGQYPGKLNMYDPAVFAIRIQGEIGEDRAEYFGARTISMERGESGFPVTVLKGYSKQKVPPEEGLKGIGGVDGLPQAKQVRLKRSRSES